MGCFWLARLSHPVLSFGAAFLLGAGWFLVWDALKAGLAIAAAQGITAACLRR